MTWASGRRFIILGIIVLLAIAAASAIAYFSLHKAPSCMDGKQNQDETGIDCGGGCTTVCSAAAAAPIVSFTRALPITDTRTDLVAYVTNPNPDAQAKGAKYTVDLYDAARTQVGEKKGTIDLPAGAQTAIYIPNAYAGNDPVAQVFLSFDDGLVWTRATALPNTPVVRGTQLAGTADAPRILASIENQGVTPLTGVKLIATVFDSAGNAMAASQTVLPTIAADATAQATFTWPVAFPADVARVDVRPVLSLP